MRPRTDPFEWCGGHPALDLVNTLDERRSDAPIETLATYRDLVQFVELAGLVSSSLAARLVKHDGRACARIAQRTRRMRERLHDVLAAAHPGRPARRLDLDAISAAVHAAHAARRLVACPSPGMANHDWSRASAREIPMHACALVVERLLVDEDRVNIRKCGAADCGVFFLDTSKSGRRQWCSMTSCGNRQKQRRWRTAAG